MTALAVELLRRNPLCFRRMGTFGDTLKRLRKKLRLSQDALGAKAGLNGQTISNIETGAVAEPQGETYRRIAAALGRSVEELAAEVEQNLVTLEIPRERYDAIVAEAKSHNRDPLEHIWARCRPRTKRITQRLRNGAGAVPASRNVKPRSPRK